MGDVFCLLQLGKLFREKYGKLDFYTHPNTHRVLNEFVVSSSLADKFSCDEFVPTSYERWLSPCGYPFHEGFPAKKMSDHIIRYFAKEAGLLIPDGSIPQLQIASYSPPEKIQKLSSPFYITIQVKTGWSKYKEWPLDRWFNLIRLIKERTGALVYQIGGPGDPKIRGADGDFLNDGFLTNLSAQSWARIHIGLDSIFNHTTNIKWSHKNSVTPAVVIFGSTDPTGFGYPQNDNLFLNLGCQPCYRENPEISDRPGGPCPFKHECMQWIDVEDVYKAALKKL